MTATDELRRMLDERGVEWMPCAWDPQTETFYKNGDGVAFIAMESTAQNGFLLRTDMPVTPEQAIAATMGQRTCRNVSGLNPVDVFTCSECGRSFIVNEFKVDVDGVLDDDSPFEFEPRYCPNCGAKVVDE